MNFNIVFAFACVFLTEMFEYDVTHRCQYMTVITGHRTPSPHASYIDTQIMFLSNLQFS